MCTHQNIAFHFVLSMLTFLYNLLEEIDIVEPISLIDTVKPKKRGKRAAKKKESTYIGIVYGHMF